MKRARQILLGLLAGCVILVLATVLTFTDFYPGPVYEGRSLRSWVVQYRDNRDVNPRSVPGSPHSVREPAEDEPAMRRRFRADKTQAQQEKAEQAAQVIQRAGATCIPHLLKWISYEQPAWKQKLYNNASSFDDPDGDYSFFDAIPRDPGELRAENAIIALEVLREGARAAVPELARLAVNTNSESAARAMACLPHLGADAFWQLIGIFTNQQFDTLTRMTAGCQLGWMRYVGTNTQAALPVLLPYLSDTNADLAQTAAYTLGALRTDPEICVPALSNCLHSADSRVRHAAASSLMRFGPEALPAKNQIGVVLNEEDKSFGKARMSAWLRRNAAN